MLARLAAAAAALSLGACAAQSAPDSARAPPPPSAPGAYAQPAPAQMAAAPPAAPAVSTQAAPTQSGDGDITVPGQVERQVEPPAGDPRSVAERMEDIRAWDRCVMQVQGQGESNPMRPQLDVPEDVCARELGMADRTAVPAARLERRRR